MAPAAACSQTVYNVLPVALSLLPIRSQPAYKLIPRSSQTGPNSTAWATAASSYRSRAAHSVLVRSFSRVDAGERPCPVARRSGKRPIPLMIPDRLQTDSS